jgi:hypothetical protein
MTHRILPVLVCSIIVVGTALFRVVLGQPAGQDPKQQTNSFGSSGGNVNDSIGGKCCSGTLGSLVFIGSKKYILSNNHVIGMMGKAAKGDPVSQPGLIDTQCKPPRTVAKFTLAAPVTSNVDAGIAELVDGTMDPTGSILGIGVPASQLVSPTANMKVLKSGRSSGVTHGAIQSYSTDLKVDYSEGCKGAVANVIPFTDQIVIVSESGAFSSSGDSGSLVMTESKQPVGLLFAGSSTLTVANPIKDVLDSLSKASGQNVAFASGSAFLAESAQTMELTMQAKKALASKQELSSKLMSEESVLGVGVTGTAAEPEVILYVQEEVPALKMNTAGIKFQAEGAEYNGMRTRIVKTDRIRAFGWNETVPTTQECKY